MKKYETWSHLVPAVTDIQFFATQMIAEVKKEKPNYAKIKAWARDIAVAIDADIDVSESK